MTRCAFLFSFFFLYKMYQVSPFGFPFTCLYQLKMAFVCKDRVQTWRRVERHKNISRDGARRLYRSQFSEAGLLKGKRDLVLCGKRKRSESGWADGRRLLLAGIDTGTPNAISLSVNNSHGPHGVIPKQDSFCSLKQSQVTNNISQKSFYAGWSRILRGSSYCLICNHPTIHLPV